MATPVLRALRGARPGARIVAACRPGLDALLAGSPWLDAVVVGQSKHAGGLLGLARRLRRERPDAALLLPNSFRSALLARLAGARRRVGYRRYGRSVLLSAGLPPPATRLPVPAVDYYCRLGAWALGVREIEPRMELFVTEADRAEAERHLDGVPRPYAVLCPGASKAAKRWPPQRFAAVADGLAGRGLAVVATGAPDERALVAEVARAAETAVHDLATRGVTMGGLKAVIDGADLCVTNDTGPRHLAAALQTPVVTLFGPTDHRWTSIDCPRERILLAQPFLPETLTADDHPRSCAITRIPVSDVLSAARQLLDASRPAAPPGTGAAPAPTSAG
jgi:heptosyltransferase-2